MRRREWAYGEGEGEGEAVARFAETAPLTIARTLSTAAMNTSAALVASSCSADFPPSRPGIRAASSPREASMRSKGRRLGRVDAAAPELLHLRLAGLAIAAERLDRLVVGPCKARRAERLIELGPQTGVLAALAHLLDDAVQASRLAGRRGLTRSSRFRPDRRRRPLQLSSRPGRRSPRRRPREPSGGRRCSPPSAPAARPGQR